MPTLNYTTSVPADRSISEIQKALVKQGASDVSTHYDESQRPDGLSFVLPTAHGPRVYKLPVDIAAVHELLQIQHRRSQGVSRAQTTLAHAERVAWRVMKDWIKAQLAIIEAKMATLDQVMLPYMYDQPSQSTIYELFKANEQRALEAG